MGEGAQDRGVCTDDVWACHRDDIDIGAGRENAGACEDVTSDCGGVVDETTPATLEDLHRLLYGEVLEGGAENVWYNESAKNSDYYPADSITQLVIFVFVFKHRVFLTAYWAPLSDIRTDLSRGGAPPDFSGDAAI